MTVESIGHPRTPLVQGPCEVMGLERARFTHDLPELLSPHDMQWADFMPADWKLGAPLGNGDVGATVHGQPRDLSFTLAKSDVWDRRNDGRTVLPGKTFADYRDTYFRRDEAAKQRLYEEMARDWQIDKPHLTTCGTLRLHIDEGQNPDQIRMRARLLDGTVEITFGDRRLEAFMSREFDVLLIDFDRGVGNVSPNPIYDCYDRFLPEPELAWELSRPPLDVNPRAEPRVADGFHFLMQRFAAGGGYTIGVAIAGAGEARHALLPGRIAGHCALESDEASRTARGAARPPAEEHVSDATEWRASGPRAGVSDALCGGRRVQVYVTVVSTDDADDTQAEARRRLAVAVAAGPTRIRDAHRAWWDQYWRRGLCSVGDRAVETPYYRGLYLAGSCFRPGCQSPGLQGVWCGENYPVWFADYHSNINIQCIYWGLLANNRADLFEPYLRLYHGFTGPARAVARDYFHMRGLKFPHAGSIGGHELSAAGFTMLSVDPCESVWVAQMFWNYYQYTLDRRFLAEVAYPILRDVALFLADYLMRDPQTGRWTMAPIVHFEASCPESFHNWGTNSLWGQTWFRVGFMQAIAAGETLGVDADLRAEWNDKLRELADPPTDDQGNWKSWENYSQNAESRHNFQLPLVFPGELVSAWHGPEAWRQTALRTWEHLRASGTQSCTGNAWCGGQGLLEIVRLGDAERAFAGARWQTEANAVTVTPPSGFGVSPGGFYAGSWMQADHAIGMCRPLADFMVMEVDGVLRLFAGIPGDMPARFHSLRAPGGFLLSAEKRGDTVDYVLVRPTAATRLRLAVPWPRARVFDLATGETVHGSGAEILDVELTSGRDYGIEPADRPLARLPRMAFHDFGPNRGGASAVGKTS